MLQYIYIYYAKRKKYEKTGKTKLNVQSIGVLRLLDYVFASLHSTFDAIYVRDANKHYMITNGTTRFEISCFELNLNYSNAINFNGNAVASCHGFLIDVHVQCTCTLYTMRMRIDKNNIETNTNQTNFIGPSVPLTRLSKMQIAQTTFLRYKHTWVDIRILSNKKWLIWRKLILRMGNSSPILIVEGRVFGWLVWIARM